MEYAKVIVIVIAELRYDAKVGWIGGLGLACRRFG